MSGEYNRTSLDANGDGAGPGSHDGEPGSPSAAAPSTSDGVPPSTAGTAPAAPVAVPKEVEEVIYSDIGLATLLTRLKQSIASARDFASLLQKRSKLEEEQASGLKKLARLQLDTIKRSEARGGSYAAQLTEVMRTQERMGDNGMQFALSLHQMHEDLNVLSNNMERERKTWKHEALDTEKRASDAEAAMHKAKTRYDSLAEDYDRARTGDTKGSRRIGLKGPKSAEQYESDLLRKVQAADADYEEKVRLAKSLREGLVNAYRPNAVQKLKELCRECDSGLTLQLQKFATFSEKLLLGNGLAVSPLPGGETKSLRDIIQGIDNDSDFHHFIAAQSAKVPARPSEIRYEQHHTLAPKTQMPASRNVSGGPQTPSGGAGGAAVREPTLNVNGPSSQQGSTASRFSSQPPPPGPIVAPSQSAAYNPPSSSGFGQQASSSYGQSQSSYNPSSAPLRDTYNDNTFPGNNPPYPIGPNDRTGTSSSNNFAPPALQTTGSIPLPSQQHQGNRAEGRGPFNSDHHRTNTAGFASGTQNSLSSAFQAPTAPPQTQNLPPLRPVFGVSLEELFQRDQSAVPMVVIQCILAVDHFGLEIEGIYRQSGTSSHVALLRDQFNHNPAGVDFRNPANFYHDVNSVATLLKLFFRELPDPLFTLSGYVLYPSRSLCQPPPLPVRFFFASGLEG
jgi:Rho GTPase-activating protein RGD1